MASNKRQSMGIIAALSSATLLGLAPVFGNHPWVLATGCRCPAQSAAA
jgi:hypothetical protein